MKITRKQTTILLWPASLQPGSQASHGIYCCPEEEAEQHSPPFP